ncbi:MAG: transcription termination/antitermination protein NusG [Anaerolineales bacterium]|jgi:transcriptional antiterminator NusG
MTETEQFEPEEGLEAEEDLVEETPDQELVDDSGLEAEPAVEPEELAQGEGVDSLDQADPAGVSRGKEDQGDMVEHPEELAEELEEEQPESELEELFQEDEAVHIEEESIDSDQAEEEADQEQPEEEPEDDGRRWYVVHCYSGYENKVRHNLEQRIETMGMKSKIFDVVVPTEEEIEVKEGKRRTVERRVFPGYILVQMIMDEDSWYVVRNTPGVTGFVGMGNEPTPLRPEEVASIVKRMEADAPRIKVTYKTGQKVRIIDGPFNDFIGTVDDIDMERAKVRVMVSFFGRETPVELDFLQVEKA